MTETIAQRVLHWDQDTTHQVASKRDTPAVKATGILAEIADQPQLIAASLGTVVIGIAMRRGDLIRGGSRMLVAHLAATAVKNAVKSRIDRTRPAAAEARGRHRLTTRDASSDDHDENAFPSGHTAGAVAVALAGARDIDGAAIPMAAGALAVAAAQPATGAHYFTDVVAGAVVGWVSEAIVSAVYDRVEPLVEREVRRWAGTAG